MRPGSLVGDHLEFTPNQALLVGSTTSQISGTIDLDSLLADDAVGILVTDYLQPDRRSDSYEYYDNWNTLGPTAALAHATNKRGYGCAWNMADLQIGGSVRMIPLMDNRNIYYTHDIGNYNLQMIGQFRATSPLGLSVPWNIVPLNAIDGRFLDNGTAGVFTTINPSDVPVNTIGYIGTLDLIGMGANVDHSAGTLVVKPGSQLNQISGAIGRDTYDTRGAIPVIMGSSPGGEIGYRWSGLAQSLTILASYAIVETGMDAGYHLPEYLSSPITLLSNSEISGWQTVTIPGAKPGDIAVLETISDNQGTATGIIIYGVQLRSTSNMITNHQPIVETYVTDATRLPANHRQRSVTYVMVDNSSQIEAARIGGIISLDLIGLIRRIGG